MAGKSTEKHAEPKGRKRQPKPMVFGAFMEVGEAATYLRIGRSTLYCHFKSGALTPVKIGRRTLVKRADLDGFIERVSAKTAGAHVEGGADAR